MRDHNDKTIKDECSYISNSYANIAKSGIKPDHAVVQTPECLKKVIQHAMEEELAEENEKKPQSKNLVLHGVSEQVKDVKSWSDDLMKDLHTNDSIKKKSYKNLFQKGQKNTTCAF